MYEAAVSGNFWAKEKTVWYLLKKNYLNKYPINKSKGLNHNNIITPNSISFVSYFRDGFEVQGVMCITHIIYFKKCVLYNYVCMSNL